MNIEKLIQENPSLNLTINAEDLLEFGEAIANKTAQTVLYKNSDRFLSRQEVMDRFGICSSSLWRYTKMGLLPSKKLGNRLFYPESGLKELVEQKKGPNDE